MISSIVAVGKFGLKLDDLKSRWINFDSSFKDVASLRKGMVVDIELSKAGKIIKVSDASRLVGVSDVKDVVVPPSLSSCPSHQELNILKAQCLNFVFDKLDFERLNKRVYREQAYELALVMFKELQLRNYHGW